MVAAAEQPRRRVSEGAVTLMSVLVSLLGGLSEGLFLCPHQTIWPNVRLGQVTSRNVPLPPSQQRVL